MSIASSQPASKQVMLTMRADHVEALDALVNVGVASNRSELVDKIVGGFIADLKKGQQPNQQNQQSALGNLIAFLLIVVGIAAIAEALGGKN